MILFGVSGCKDWVGNCCICVLIMGVDLGLS